MRKSIPRKNRRPCSATCPSVAGNALIKSLGNEKKFLGTKKKSPDEKKIK
jgi:hypothetical protein